MKKITCFLFALAMAARPALAQIPGPAEDTRLSEVLDSIRGAADLPALAGMIIHGDSILEMAAVGVRAYGRDAAVTVEDRWHAGSNTKAMTATLAGVLVDRGEIGWRTTVGAIFPDLRDSIRSEFLDVTLAELLSHTGGVSNNLFQTPSWRTLRRDSASLRDQRRAWILEILNLDPTARGGYLYSNGGYIVAGAMLERVSDVSWEVLVRREIFEPLGMRNAGFGPLGTVGADDEPLGHVVRAGKTYPVEPGVMADNPAALGPAGTVHASLADFARFASAHLAGGRGTDGLVRSETFAILHTPVDEEAAYALGWLVMERPWAGGAALTHSGSNTMWFHTVWVAPARNFAVVAVTNVAGARTPAAVDGAIGVLIQRAGILLERAESR